MGKILSAYKAPISWLRVRGRLSTSTAPLLRLPCRIW